MADVRDILGVPRGAASAEKADAPAKPKERMQRPAGMSREAFALLGGLHPIVPSVLTEELRKKEDLKGLKQKRKSSAKGQVKLPDQAFDELAGYTDRPQAILTDRSRSSGQVHLNVIAHDPGDASLT